MNSWAPIAGLWESRQQARELEARNRFVLTVRVAQAHLEAVVCAGCGHALDCSTTGATTSPAGVTRCAPCRHKATGK